MAAEAHYHRSCYKEYTRTDDCKNIKGERKTEPSECETTETQAYEMLCQYIREDIISNPRVIKFTELITKLSFYTSNLGVLRITDLTRNNLKRRLETTFGTLLHFEKEIEGKRPLVVFPDNLTKLNLIRDNIRLQKQIELNKHCLESSENVQQAALFICQSIKEQEKWLKTWPPTASELNESSVFLPESLGNLLVTLTGNSEAEELSARVKRLVNSFGQDLVYGVTCGSRRMRKHILLLYAIKSLTSNVELINMVNRCGHGISYTQLEEIDTALCIQKMNAAESEDKVPLPDNIHPHVSTTLAWDNIDRLEETLSGGGTSHRVNGMPCKRQSEDIWMDRIQYFYTR